MPFIEVSKDDGRVTGFQDAPRDVCMIAETEVTTAAEVSDGQLERVLDAMSAGTVLELRGGRLYEVTE